MEPIRTTKTVAAVPNFISTPADIAGIGVVNFISVVFSLVWALVLGATLLVKPDWRGSQASTAVTAAVVGE